MDNVNHTNPLEMQGVGKGNAGQLRENRGAPYQIWGPIWVVIVVYTSTVYFEAFWEHSIFDPFGAEQNGPFWGIPTIPAIDRWPYRDSVCLISVP